MRANGGGRSSPPPRRPASTVTPACTPTAPPRPGW
jgi:hypothetical protein